LQKKKKASSGSEAQTEVTRWRGGREGWNERIEDEELQHLKYTKSKANSSSIPRSLPNKLHSKKPKFNALPLSSKVRACTAVRAAKRPLMKETVPRILTMPPMILKAWTVRT